MNNYKKLLFAGLAIVPLALSSWTSEGNSLDYGNGNINEVSSVELAGGTAVSSSVTVNTKKKVLSKETVETVSVASQKAISTSIDPVLTFDKVLENYK